MPDSSIFGELEQLLQLKIGILRRKTINRNHWVIEALTDNWFAHGGAELLGLCLKHQVVESDHYMILGL